MDKHEEMRAKAREWVGRWNFRDRVRMINAMHSEGYIRVCPNCGGRFVYSPLWLRNWVIEQGFHPAIEGEAENFQEMYWTRLGWIDGLGIKIATNGKCGQCAWEAHQKLKEVTTWNQSD